MISMALILGAPVIEPPGKIFFIQSTFNFKSSTLFLPLGLVPLIGRVKSLLFLDLINLSGEEERIW